MAGFWNKERPCWSSAPLEHVVPEDEGSGEGDKTGHFRPTLQVWIIRAGSLVATAAPA